MGLFEGNKSVLFNSLNSGQIVYTPENEDGFIKLFTTNADLFSVINYLWMAINKIDIVVLGKNGEPKDSGRLYDLTQMPNPFQSWDEFFIQYGQYKSVLGNTYVFTPRITENRFSEMYVLPAQYTKIVAGDVFRGVNGYKVETVGGWSKDFSAEDVLHVREPNLRHGQGVEMYGMSRLMPGGKSVDTNQAAQDANASKQQNRGVEGIVTVKGTANSDSGEKESNRLKRTFDALIYGKGKQGRFAVTNRELDFLDLSKGASDLNTNETQDRTLMQFCNLFNIPPVLLMPNINSTYNNVREADKALYKNAAIPEVQQFCNKFNVHIGNAFGGDTLWYDTTGIEALQANMKELVEWVTKAPLTIDEMRELLDREPTREEIYLPNSISPVGLVDRPEGMEDNKL